MREHDVLAFVLPFLKVILCRSYNLFVMLILISCHFVSVPIHCVFFFCLLLFRYGETHPVFFIGSLEDVLKESLQCRARDVSPISSVSLN